MFDDFQSTLIDTDLAGLSAEDICRRIANLTLSTVDLLSNGHGWAPAAIQRRLDDAGLAYQSSLALSLSRWLTCESEGDLILAWVNLGALVEGAMQLLLITYDDAYKKDPNARRDKKNLVKDAEQTRFEDLRDFCAKSVWNPAPVAGYHIVSFRDWDPYVALVQNRRNAIHAIRRREIGSFVEWRQMLPLHLSFIRDIYQNKMDGRYPDDYSPNEND